MRVTPGVLHLTILFATITLTLFTSLAQPQRVRRMPTPPPSAQDDANKNDTPARPDSQAAKRAQLAQNEKEFREGVERLYQLTNNLRDQVRQTTTSGILSIHMYKQTQEIENLAKQLKNKAKGS
jgi:hypothetical protein